MHGGMGAFSPEWALHHKYASLYDSGSLHIFGKQHSLEVYAPSAHGTRLLRSQYVWVHTLWLSFKSPA